MVLIAGLGVGGGEFSRMWFRLDMSNNHQNKYIVLRIELAIASIGT